MVPFWHYMYLNSQTVVKKFSLHCWLILVIYILRESYTEMRHWALFFTLAVLKALIQQTYSYLNGVSFSECRQFILRRSTRYFGKMLRLLLVVEFFLSFVPVRVRDLRNVLYSSYRIILKVELHAIFLLRKTNLYNLRIFEFFCYS